MWNSIVSVPDHCLFIYFAISWSYILSCHRILGLLSRGVAFCYMSSNSGFAISLSCILSYVSLNV